MIQTSFETDSTERTPPASSRHGRHAASIARVLGRIRGRARFWIWCESLALIALLAASYFWLSLVLDRLFEPPPAMRAAGLTGILAGLLILVAQRLVGRLRAPLADDELALLVERRNPSFRDSLSTAVGAATRNADEPVDVELLARSTAQATEMLSTVRIGDLFKTSSLMALFALAAAAVGGIAWFASTAPDVVSLWARRMVLMSPERWPRDTRLTVEGFPDGVRRVARGSDVDIVVKADGSGRVPESVELRSRSEQASNTDRMGRRGGLVDGQQAFGHLLVDVRRDLELSIRGGDDRIEGLKLAVVDPPGVASLEIAYTPPAYLGSQERSLRPAGLVELPRGSTVRIVVTADKSLSKATIRGRRTPPAAVASGVRDAVANASEQAEKILASIGADGEPRPKDARHIEATLDDIDGTWTVMIDMTDGDGVATPRPTTFRIVAMDDAPPQLVVSLLGISSVVTPRARVPVIGTIRDDHGLASAATIVRRGRLDGPGEGGRANEAPSSSPPAVRSPSDDLAFPIRRLAVDSPLLELPEAAPESVDLEPLRLEPGGVVMIEVMASDGCELAGGANVVRSDAWTLEVVSPERLSSMLEARELVLRRRFENVVEEFTAAREQLIASGRGDATSRPEPDQDDEVAGDQPEADAVRRLGDASDRCRGETSEIARAFLEIRREFDNNRLLSDELDTRLFAQIAGPLSEIADGELPLLAAACRRVRATSSPPADMVDQLDAPSAAVLARLREVLDRMLELETFNEVVEILRSAIRSQEGLREETIRRQKERARSVLEGE